jgi:hypothetical protein
VRGVTFATIPEAMRERNEASLANLIRHVDRYGLDSKHAGYRGREAPYKSYKAFAKDTAAMTAFGYLSEDGYVQFVERYGMSAWADDARADHQEARA